MNKLKITILSVSLLATVAIVSAFRGVTPSYKKLHVAAEKEKCSIQPFKQKQSINMFVTHGHCSTPFAGIVDSLLVNIPNRNDGGNPMENFQLSFEVNPNSFAVCANEELTNDLKTPGLFVGKKNENLKFTSTNVYTMGMDWYQVNGKMAIKGVEKDVKFFLTGIREVSKVRPESFVLEGQLNLLDWGIDYEKIVNGKSSHVSTKWLHLNMRLPIEEDC